MRPRICQRLLLFAHINPPYYFPYDVYQVRGTLSYSHLLPGALLRRKIPGVSTLKSWVKRIS